MEADGAAHRKAIDKFIKRMASLSTTVGKVMEICSQTDASPNELNKVISLDPVLTGQGAKTYYFYLLFTHEQGDFAYLGDHYAWYEYRSKGSTPFFGLFMTQRDFTI